MRVILLAALLGGFFVAGPANAELVCGRRADIAEILLREYREQRTAFGLSERLDLIELYSSADGSFTIVVTAATGASCVLVAGEHWERKDGRVFPLPPAPEEKTH